MVDHIARNSVSASTFVRDMVTEFYLSFFQRQPDEKGLEFHINNILDNKISIKHLMEEFGRSSEFQGWPILNKGETFVSISFMGCTFLLPADSLVLRDLQSDYGYEPWVLPYFLDQCRPGMGVLDVGASWGVFSLPAAKRVGQGGRVAAVEVSSRNCKILLQSVKASGISNLELLPFGLSDQVGSAIIPARTRGNNNIVQTLNTSDLPEYQDVEVVPVLPLDLISSKIGRINIVKMDIEGMEYRAVLGGLKFFSEMRPLLFLEYSPKFQSAGSGVDGKDLLAMLLSKNYKIEILHSDRPREFIRGDSMSDEMEKVDAAWRQHLEQDGGSHLDLCFHP